MVLSEDTLFVAGPPNLIQEERVFRRISDPVIEQHLRDQLDAVAGRRGRCSKLSPRPMAVRWRSTVWSPHRFSTAWPPPAAVCI